MLRRIEEKYILYLLCEGWTAEEVGNVVWRVGEMDVEASIKDLAGTSTVVEDGSMLENVVYCAQGRMRPR